METRLPSKPRWCLGQKFMYNVWVSTNLKHSVHKFKIRGRASPPHLCSGQGVSHWPSGEQGGIKEDIGDGLRVGCEPDAGLRVPSGGVGLVHLSHQPRKRPAASGGKVSFAVPPREALLRPTPESVQVQSATSCFPGPWLKPQPTRHLETLRCPWRPRSGRLEAGRGLGTSARASRAMSPSQGPTVH